MSGRRWRSTGWLVVSALACLIAAGCGGDGDAAADTEEGMEATLKRWAGEGPKDPNLLERLPATCPLLPAAEASEILGQTAEVPGPNFEGQGGGLCLYRASRDRQIRLMLVQVSHDVWDPETGALEELAERMNWNRSEVPETRVWEEAPGLGGYYAEEGQTTRAWIVTPYGWTHGMAGRATAQVVLGASIEAPLPPSERLAALREIGERAIPRMKGG